MALRRALFRPGSAGRFVVFCPSLSGSLQAGQRLAKPGLSGRSSNSSEQMAQILTGNGIQY